MLAKPTTRASIFCKRLYHLKCFNCKKHLISYFSTQSLPQPSRSLAKTQNYKTFIVRCNSQITKYGRNGSIGESESINNRMPIKSAISWIALLTDYARNGEIIKARELFDKMPHRITASYNAMISAYIRNNCMIDEAFELFARIPEYNARSYSTMIAGFVKAGMLGKAEKLYYETPVKLRDPACSNALISGYLKFGYLEEAFRVFCGMLDRDVVSWSAMVDGYCKMGRIVDARRLFDTTPDRNVVTWTAMINGYMKSEDFEEGFKLFLEMRREQRVESNSTTFSVMFDACRSFAGYEEGIQMHGLVARMGFDYDIFLGNSIIAMYCRFGCIGAASKIFHMMRETDVVSWNSLIAGYVQCTEIEEAFKLFERMPKKDVTSWTTIISGFFKKGLSDKAIQLFRMMPEKDSFAWTALISGFVNNEEYEEAFRWFIEMLQREVRLGPLTISSVLSASAGLASLNQGLQIHALVVKMCMEFDLSIQNSLVSMYSKCGDLVNACEIFTGIRSPNIISYNSMITGFSQNGFGKEALILFSKMQKEGIKPNEVTFLGVLSACVHVGLVEEGWKYFELMKPIYNIEPGPNHYACMVDLLGRAGLLDEAMELIDSMPFEPHAGVWGALLGTSRTHLRLDLARIAAEQLIELQPDNGTPYVVLSNLCSLSGNTKDGNQIRMAKKSKGVRKSPGCSWIIVKDKVNLFLAADRSHMDLEEIKATLRFIATEMKHMHCY